MTIDRVEAEIALDTITRSRRHASELRGYADAGDTLIGWGIAWLAGNLTSQFDPPLARIIWPVAIAIAVLWSVFRPRRQADPRILATIGVTAAYLMLTLAIVHPDARTGNAIIALLVAACYSATGIWVGPRFAILGLMLVGAVLIGWFILPAWFFLCLAVGGGGTLLFGGLWLRRA